MYKNIQTFIAWLLHTGGRANLRSNGTDDKAFSHQDDIYFFQPKPAISKILSNMLAIGFYKIRPSPWNTAPQCTISQVALSLLT